MWVEERKHSFKPDVAKKASAVAAPLAAWVVANVKFSYILDKIKPLEQEQSKLQRSLKMAEDQIGNLSSGLDEVDAQVKVLQERLNKFTKEAAITEIQLNKTTETIKVKWLKFVHFKKTVVRISILVVLSTQIKTKSTTILKESRFATLSS